MSQKQPIFCFGAVDGIPQPNQWSCGGTIINKWRWRYNKIHKYIHKVNTYSSTYVSALANND